ncbi:transposase [Streptococcus pneumoniae]|nr:transposase [Streptococcus pneumoniae]
MKAQAIVTSQGRIVSLDITVNYCHDMKLFKMSRRNIGQTGKTLAVMLALVISIGMASGTVILRLYHYIKTHRVS